jgi:hypothetical protein
LTFDGAGALPRLDLKKAGCGHEAGTEKRATPSSASLSRPTAAGRRRQVPWPAPNGRSRLGQGTFADDTHAKMFRKQSPACRQTACISGRGAARRNIAWPLG